MTALALALAFSALQDETDRTSAIYRCPAEETSHERFSDLVDEYQFDTLCIDPEASAKTVNFVKGKMVVIKPSAVDTAANRKWRDATIEFINSKISPKEWLKRTQNLKETVHYLSSPATPTLRDATGKVSYRATLGEMLILSWPGTPLLTSGDVWKTRWLPEAGALQSWILAMNDWLGPMLQYRCDNKYITKGTPKIIRADDKPGLLVYERSEGDKKMIFYFNNSKESVSLTGIDLEHTTVTRGMMVEDDNSVTLSTCGSIIVEYGSEE